MSDDKIIVLHPTAWMAPDWLPTGEALVGEWMARHGQEFCFLDDEGTWYRFNGRVWERDQLRRVNVLAGELCREIGRTKKRSLRMKLEASRTVLAIPQRAKDECAIEMDRFDHHPAINTPSGEWTGRDKCVPNEREHYHSKITSVPSPSVKEPVLWLRHLKKIFGGNQALIDYLQRLCGYCCSTSNGEQVLVCFFGSGQNGKTVVIKTIAGILGSYAAQASIETFLASKFDRHPEELAAFRGVRLVVASEPDASRAWNESMIKQITGGEKLRARFMRQNSFEYQPLFKIIVLANHKPQLRTTDKAIRRRFHIVPFTIQIADTEKVMGYEERLVEEWPAIFSWMLKGLDEWNRIGLAPPDEVIQATSEYIESQDVRSDWMAERCDLLPTAVTPTADLYADWKRFAEDRGEHAGSQRAMVDHLKGMGLILGKTSDGNKRAMKGITLKVTEAMQQQHSMRFQG